MNGTNESLLTLDEHRFNRFLDELMTGDAPTDQTALNDLERLALQLHQATGETAHVDLTTDPVLTQILSLQSTMPHPVTPLVGTRTHSGREAIALPTTPAPATSTVLKIGNWAAILVLSLVSVALFARFTTSDNQRLRHVPAASQQSDVMFIDWILGLPAAPAGIAVAPDGNLWIPVADIGQIEIYSPEGELLETWGVAGSDPGQFRFGNISDEQPDSGTGVTWDSDGNIYVADPGNHRVQKFDPARNYLFSFGTDGVAAGAVSYPDGVTIGPDHLVYVVDAILPAVKQFDPDGTLVRVFAGGGITTEVSMMPGPPQFDREGHVWIPSCRDSVIYQYRLDRTLLDTIGVPGSGIGEFDCPKSIAIGADGMIYVADYGNQRIQVLDRDGGYVAQWEYVDDETQFRPYALTIGKDGSLYVLDYDDHRVVKLDPSPNLP